MLYCVLALIAVAAPDVAPKTEPPDNLVVNGDFERGRLSPFGWDRPGGVRVSWQNGIGVDGTRGVCIEMDKRTAEGYGQGYFSKRIPVEAGTVYRLTVDVKSDGPNAILFVKGFARVKMRYREVYSHHKEVHFDRYLKEYIRSGRFVTQSFTFSPRHNRYRVGHVKVWLYGYLKPGKLFFDNVQLERVGKRKAETAPKPTEKKSLRPRPPDPDGEASPPIYITPQETTR